MQPVDQSRDELHFNGNRKPAKEVHGLEATRHDFNKEPRERERERHACTEVETNELEETEVGGRGEKRSANRSRS